MVTACLFARIAVETSLIHFSLQSGTATLSLFSCEILREKKLRKKCALTQSFQAILSSSVNATLSKGRND